MDKIKPLTTMKLKQPIKITIIFLIQTGHYLTNLLNYPTSSSYTTPLTLQQTIHQPNNKPSTPKTIAHSPNNLPNIQHITYSPEQHDPKAHLI